MDWRFVSQYLFGGIVVAEYLIFHKLKLYSSGITVFPNKYRINFFFFVWETGGLERYFWCEITIS